MKQEQKLPDMHLWIIDKHPFYIYDKKSVPFVFQYDNLLLLQHLPL